MKTVGQKVSEFRITGVKPGFNRHEENGQSAFEELNEKSFAGKWKIIYFSFEENGSLASLFSDIRWSRMLNRVR